MGQANGVCCVVYHNICIAGICTGVSVILTITLCLGRLPGGLPYTKMQGSKQTELLSPVGCGVSLGQAVVP